MSKRVYIQSLPDYSFAQLLTGNAVSLVADEPSSEGGSDLGPDPYDLFTWALGACTSMTLAMYARRKGYPLHEVAVEVDHRRTHAEDCSECVEEHDGHIEVLGRKIVVRGPLSEEQRDDLLRVAAKCPVHRTIKAAPEVVDTIDVVD